MYKEIIFVVVVICTKSIFCHLLGAVKEETTQTPIDIMQLDARYWCKFQPNSYDCGENGIRRQDWYYFDIKMEDCKPLPVVGDCGLNQNAFSSLSICKDSCRDIGMNAITPNLTENVYCRLQYDFGNCNKYYPMWYFDVSTRTCRGFSYSGCGGNQNRFGTVQDCTAACIPNVEYKPWY